VEGHGDGYTTRASWVSHVRSRAACAAAMFSASALEWATVACLERARWTGPRAKVKTIPVVERLESGFVPNQSRRTLVGIGERVV
jgi:hypothetical protein